MKILNLYSGIGGNRKLWNKGQVTAIEKNEKIAAIYKKMFPGDNLIITDAHQFLLDHYREFDFIWSSPPCQSHSRMMKATRHNVVKYFDAALWQEIVLLQHFFKGKFVIENVHPYYDCLIKPSHTIGRHLFWSNIFIPEFSEPKMPNFIGENTIAGASKMKKWLELDFGGNIYYEKNHSPTQVLRNCVHPKIGKHIFDQL